MHHVLAHEALNKFKKKRTISSIPLDHSAIKTIQYQGDLSKSHKNMEIKALASESLLGEQWN